MSEASTSTAQEKKRLDMAAVEIQQEYYEAIGDADWELFEKKDRKFLLQKVAYAICGPPSTEGNLIESVQEEDDTLKLQGYESRDEETCMKVYNKIIEQVKYSPSGENIMISVLRIVCVIPSENVPFYKRTPKNYWLDLHKKKGESVHILVFHVFRIRKCISMKHEVKGCRIYIDHDARVYGTWKDYLTQNKLPKCVMVVPQDGEYMGVIFKEGEVPHVKLSVLASPELGISAAVLSVADKMSTAANIGSLVAIAGAAIAAPALAPATITIAVGVGVTTGVYGIARAATNLVDRSRHEQSIGLRDSESRSCWINILVSTVGVSFTTAGKLLSWAAESGRNIKYVQHGEKPTKTEVFQFTTSLLFLGIGAMSNQTAQEIVQDAQAKKINEYRDSLSSNNKRKIFDKVTAETRRVNGLIEGNTEVIRCLKKIENKDDFFGSLKRMNKSVNKNKVRISLSSDGKVFINNQHKVSISELNKLGNAGRNKLLAKYGHAKVTTKNAPTRLYPSEPVAGCSSANIKELACSIRPEEIIKITTFVINLSKIDQEFVMELLQHINEQIHDGFLLLCAELISSLVPAELECLESIFPDWKRRLILILFDYLKSKVMEDENDNEFMSALKYYIRNGRIHRETLLKLKEKLMNVLSKQSQNKETRNKFFNDEYFSKYFCSFKTLGTGQIIKVGPHTILIKQNTLDNFEMWFQDYSQEKCDKFLELCFSIISDLNNDDISRLNIINPDEDILFKVSLFLIMEFEKYTSNSSMIDSVLVSEAKYDLIHWCYFQNVRNYITCKKCNGIMYK